MKNKINILHYCIYRAHYNLHLLANKINPFNLIHKLPFQKKRYEKLGIDIQKEIDKAFGNTSYGLSIMVAGILTASILCFLFLAITNILIKTLSINTVLSARYFIVFGMLSFIIYYLFVFKDDKYLLYFKDFERWTKNENRKYAWISFAFVVSVFLMFFGSLSMHG